MQPRTRFLKGFKFKTLSFSLYGRSSRDHQQKIQNLRPFKTLEKPRSLWLVIHAVKFFPCTNSTLGPVSYQWEIRWGACPGRKILWDIFWNKNWIFWSSLQMQKYFPFKAKTKNVKSSSLLLIVDWRLCSCQDWQVLVLNFWLHFEL